MTFSNHIPSLPGQLRSRGRGAMLVIALALGGAVAVAPAGAHADAVQRTASNPTSQRARVDDPAAAEASSALDLLRQIEMTGDNALQVRYTSLRDRLAAEIAFRVGIDPLEMQQAWANADNDHQAALLAGLGQLGVPYHRNTSKPGIGFDCSGLTSYAWSQAGFAIPHQSSAQIRQAAPRTYATAQAGDIMQFPGHVMMWLGAGTAILHAPYPGQVVEVDDGPYRRSVRLGDPTG